MDSLKNGLALSGGGFRATLYALGSLIRLNENGLLTELDTITAVSGGAITAGYLMLNWNKLKFEKIEGYENREKATNFEDVIVNPLLAFCGNNIVSRKKIAFYTLALWTSPAKEVEKKYKKLLFGDVKLKDIKLPDSAPEFIFYATNLDTGASVRISKDYIRDYNLGVGNNHGITLAKAVSISSAFPPFLTPTEVDGTGFQWEHEYLSPLPKDIVEKLRNKMSLCDGGLYDNLGLEMLWKHGRHKEYKVVFCCDAGSPFSKPWDVLSFLRNNWLYKSLRMTDVMINQQRALRKRTLVRNYLEHEYSGAYWSIENNLINGAHNLIDDSQINDYEKLKDLDTQLKSFGCKNNKMVVNIGYLHADYSLATWYGKGISKSYKLPFDIKSKK